jgi:hypothetical protein
MPTTKLVNAQALANLIRAAQSTLQTVNGSNPELCAQAHKRALAELADALKAMHPKRDQGAQ